MVTITNGEWIAYYNSEKLHSAIRYLTPNDVFNGRTAIRLAERKEKLHTVYIKRQEYWRTHNAGSIHTLYACLKNSKFSICSTDYS